MNEVQSVMVQPVTVNDSDAELEQELAEIMGGAWDSPKELEKPQDESLKSVDLPNLSDLNLAGKMSQMFLIYHLITSCKFY